MEKCFFRGNIVGRGVLHLTSLDETSFTWGVVRSTFPLIKENVELQLFFLEKTLQRKNAVKLYFSVYPMKLKSFHLINGYQMCPWLYCWIKSKSLTKFKWMPNGLGGWYQFNLGITCGLVIMSEPHTHMCVCGWTTCEQFMNKISVKKKKKSIAEE